MDPAIIQNPHSPAPLAILEQLVSLEVTFYNFSTELESGEIIVHSDVLTDVRDFFALALELQFPIHSVIPIHRAPFAWNDICSCEANNSSGFNYRTIMHSDTLSKHSYGWAFDINPRQNIYLRYDEQGHETCRLPKDAAYATDAPGTLIPHHPLVLLMKKRGWAWGGDWTPESGRVDYQHFEKN